MGWPHPAPWCEGPVPAERKGALRLLVIGFAVITMLILTPQLKAHYTPQPQEQIRHGADVLTFLETHPKAGTRRSRGRVYRAHRWLFYNGLRRVGVLAGFECLHSKEGSWTDPNYPHWGGLQADMSFQAAYGKRYLRLWGTADHWPVWAQLHMGYEGWRARGWTPWPNTGRVCGLV